MQSKLKLPDKKVPCKALFLFKSRIFSGSYGIGNFRYGGRKMPQDSLNESGHVNMLIKLLLSFPEIYTITLNVPSSSCRLSYMIRRKLDEKEYLALRQYLQENIETFYFLHGYEDDYHVKVLQKRCHNLTRLQVILSHNFLLGELVSLLTKIMCDLFQEDLITENRLENDAVWPGENAFVEELTLFPDSTLNHRSNHLIAFRDSGRVYIFDK